MPPRPMPPHRPLASAAPLAPRSRPQPRDAWVTGGLLLALLLWDCSGADAAVTALFGTAQGFAWREHVVTAGLLHEGGRAVAWATLLALLVCALRAPVPVGLGPGRTPSRNERQFWWAVTLLCLLLVPAIKRFSSTSCPWDLAEHGGMAQGVSHWLWGVADGGPGHCFPSGHAVGAFAFLSQYFLWRDHRRGRAQAWLKLVLVAGALFAAGQLARGAHHLSHSAWSGFLCWCVCTLASAWWRRRHQAR